MNHTVDIVLTDLRHLISMLGQNGGLVGPSIYDTARILRLAPTSESAGPALQWLVDQQQHDGGWGSSDIPRTRHVPTLAAVITLDAYGTRSQDYRATQAGLLFLKRQAYQWEDVLPDDIPVGIELILPSLLDEAARVGLGVVQEPFSALISVGKISRMQRAQKPLEAGTLGAHLWESLGTQAGAALVDQTGGVGHSPTATAAWLQATEGREDLNDAREAARNYLKNAAKATGVGIPGVVPTIWPIDRFEQVGALHTLVYAGLLDYPGISDLIQQHINDLAQAFEKGNLGLSDHFTPDGDTTACAITTLRGAGRPVDSTRLQKFVHGDLVWSYPGEFPPSLSTIAHATHALTGGGSRHQRMVAQLLKRQQRDGSWPADQGSISWIYMTWQVLVALSETEHKEAMLKAGDALITSQHPDGGWGETRSSISDTAFAILALSTLARVGLLAPAAQQVLERAKQWMLRSYQPFSPVQDATWLGKVVYRPRRLARVIELVATLLAANLNDIPCE